MFEFVVISISDTQLSCNFITRMTLSTKRHCSSKPSRNDCDIGRCDFVEISDHAHDFWQTQSVLSKCGHAPYTLSHESHKRSARLLKLFTASKQKRYLTRHSLISFMVSPACSISVHKVKQPSESMATEEVETFLYMSDTPPTAFHRWPDLKVELKRGSLRISWTLQSGTQTYLNQLAHRSGYSQQQCSSILGDSNSELASLAQEVYHNVNVFLPIRKFRRRKQINRVSECRPRPTATHPLPFHSRRAM
jgi:hypothetical protein